MQRILFIELLGGIGDVLIALPAIQALGRTEPDAELTVLTFAPGGELLQTDPLIHSVICVDRQQDDSAHRARNAVVAVLEHHTFDLIVSDTNYDEIERIIQASGAPRVVTNLWRSPPANQRVGDRFLQILLAEGLIQPETIAAPQLYLTPVEIHTAQQQLHNCSRPLVVLVVDAGMAIKQWSTPNIIELGQKLQQQYSASIIVPAGFDPAYASQLVSLMNGNAQVWTTGTLRELAALLAIADLVITPDTGPAHIAAALQTPTITLFGPSWHERYGHSAPHVNLQGYPVCPERNISNFTTQSCWYSGECPFDRWQTCLEDISVTDVLAAAASLLAAPTSTPQASTSALSPPTPELGSPLAELSPPTSALSSLSVELSPPIAELKSLTSEPSPPLAELSPPISELNSPLAELNSPISQPGPPISELSSPIAELSSPDPNLQPTPSPSPPFSPSPPLPLPSSLPSWQQWSTARNILVMRLDNIGDVLMTSPALRAIKTALPHSHLTLMASPGGAQAADLLPWVDDVLVWRTLWQDLGKLAFDPEREWQLIQTLHDRQFDAAVIFTSFSQTPHPAGIMCYLAGIPLRLGESKEWGGAVLTTEVKAAPDEIHQVERNLRLIESVGFAVGDRSLSLQIPAAAAQNVIQRLWTHGLAPDDPYIVLNPWTSCQSRNYAADRFAIAARDLAEKTGYRVVVTGVEGDRRHSEPLLNTLGTAGVDLIGATTLAELAALIAKARLMLSNNTSTMHIADATRTPSVILFAGTEYECQWQPRHTPARLLRQPTPCSPCYTFTCPYNLECLDIPPERVVAAGLELLSLEQHRSQSFSQVRYRNEKSVR